MKQIDFILSHITMLFYIFVGLSILGTAYGLVMMPSSDVSPEALAQFKKMGISGAMFLILLFLALFTAGVWSTVLFIILLVRIGSAIARKNIFDMRVVRVINRYAILTGITLFLMLLVFMIMPANLTPDDFWIKSSTISAASSTVMLLILGQVLRIGHILKQEQELTV